MKRILFAGAGMLLAGALAFPAMAEGPRASSENHWRGMVSDASARQYATASEPHYVWQEGYDHGGKWHGHWTLEH